jgi:hypothetical protein
MFLSGLWGREGLAAPSPLQSGCDFLRGQIQQSIKGGKNHFY